MLTDALVSSPANSSAAPTARKNGHAVGAGSCTTTCSGRCSTDCCGVAMFFDFYRAMKYTTDSTTTQIASTKCQYSANTPMRCSCSMRDVAQCGENHDDRQASQADDHVRRVQAHQRIKRRAEQVGADGQPFVIDQLIPLARGADDKDQPQHDGEQPPYPEQLYCVALGARARPSRW